KRGYEVVTAYNGIEALGLVGDQPPDLIVLDISMPRMNGIEVCRRLRINPSTAPIPIIFLTARSMIDDKIEGFEAGADDYITKPFDIQELELRIKAILRRCQAPLAEPASDIITVGPLSLNRRTFEAVIDNQAILLTPIEFELLHHLMVHPGDVFSSERLLQEVWEYPPGTGDPALVRMHIKNLRDKLEPDSGNPILIRTVSRHGYTVRPD
ncbi:MAG: response regulator transcription factor, partial [Chloroflexota bacterium]|nr:response regulator transcription factor [Chloroflexota bacterium]